MSTRARPLRTRCINPKALAPAPIHPDRSTALPLLGCTRWPAAIFEMTDL
jgi:hypothetical protein